MLIIYIKFVFALLFVFIGSNAYSQHALIKIWETDSILPEAESVLFDNETLYVSMVDGLPVDMDGQGGIAKLDTFGKILDANWVSGLNAPKGMGLWGNNLYVTDINKVLIINKYTGHIEQSIPVKDAKGLNDITFDADGTLYVSDSELGNVHRIKNGKIDLYLSGLTGANGLKVEENNLYILTENDVLKVGPDNIPNSIAKLELGGDGIEPIGNGEFIITTWKGVIYILDAMENLYTLLDTREQMQKTADLGYNPEQHIVYVPTLNKNTVVAYLIK